MNEVEGWWKTLSKFPTPTDSPEIQQKRLLEYNFNITLREVIRDALNLAGLIYTRHSY